MATTWRLCSTCKKPIGLGATYLVCNVSTCNRVRTGLVFCSVDCWDVHLPGARHREAWSEERTAPTSPDAEPAAVASPARRQVVPTRRRDPSVPHDVLVVASKLKLYVKASSGLNTSDSVMEVLSERLRVICDRAVERAIEDGRKTLMDRDFGP